MTVVLPVTLWVTGMTLAALDDAAPPGQLPRPLEPQGAVPL